MLILSRRSGESIRINDDITITVLQAKGGQVKLGINAPREVAVHREEVYERIAQSSRHDFVENRKAETKEAVDSDESVETALA